VEVLERVDRERIAALRARDEYFWLDLRAPSAADLETLQELLGLHPVAVEDTREFGQRPKLDAYGDHALFVFYTVRGAETREEGLFAPVEVHIYVHGGFLLTVRRATCTELDSLREELRHRELESEDYLVYRVFDVLTDAYYPVIERLEAEIDGLEAEVLIRPRKDQLARIYRLKQEVLELFRRVVPQRDRFQAGAEIILAVPGLSRGSREYLRDVGDHLAQLAGELHRQQEDLTALTGTYFNANTDRINATATRLTILATFFIVWTLVTGFFGQNFGWLVDNIDTRTDFLVFGVGSLAGSTAVIGALFWVKRKDWF
jgi:magnesium transporter